MKNIKSIIFCLILVAGIFLLPQDVQAASKYFDFTSNKTGTSQYAVNMRTGPSTSYKKMVVVPAGAKVTVHGFNDISSGDWYKVTYSGKTGYMKAEYVKVTGSRFATYNFSSPSATLIKGKTVAVKGTLWSYYKISTVKVGIKNSSGSWISGQTGTASPSTYRYDISKLDSKVNFDKLAAGKYQYCVYVKDSKGKYAYALKKSFEVKNASITGSNISKPAATHLRGKDLAVKGTVKSTNKISSIKVGVYNSNGNAVTGCYKEVKPNTYSYDLSKVDSYLAFKNVKTGTYSYKVIVKDQYGFSKTLVNHSFKIKMIVGSGITKPSGNYKTGSYFTFAGKINSYNKLAQVKVGVYDEDGKAVSNCYKAVTLNTNTYDISNIDASLYFNKLTKGSYRYKVYAKDSKGNASTLVNVKFTVGMATAVTDISKFPATYQAYLAELSEAHPNWTFEVVNTGMTWDKAVANEMSSVGKQVVSTSSPDSWKSKEKGAIDVDTGKYVVFDGGWNAANKEIVKYYMDPRNFLNESNIYQFASHEFGSYHTVASVKASIANSFMAMKRVKNSSGEYVWVNDDTKATNYANYIYNSAKSLKVNPQVLVSMIITEQGWKSTSARVTGVGVDMTGLAPDSASTVLNGVKYKGIYNFFNWGAYSAKDKKGKTMTATQRGLWCASLTPTSTSDTTGRPWNTVEKSIKGGASSYVNNYVKTGQDTFYTKKFNVGESTYKKGTHEYCTNIQAPTTEGNLLKTVCKNLDDEKLVFKIPVYKNMPSKNCAKP